MSIFRRIFNRPVKYQIKVIRVSQVDIDDGVIEKWQDEGWEICGHLSMPKHDSWCAEKCIMVPFRKIIY